MRGVTDSDHSAVGFDTAALKTNHTRVTTLNSQLNQQSCKCTDKQPRNTKLKRNEEKNNKKEEQDKTGQNILLDTTEVRSSGLARATGDKKHVQHTNTGVNRELFGAYGILWNTISLSKFTDTLQVLHALRGTSAPV